MLSNEEFKDIMKGVDISTGIYDTYCKIFDKNSWWDNDPYIKRFTFGDIRNWFDRGHNLWFNYYSFYPRIILMYLYVERNNPKIIRDRPVKQYFQELEDSLPLESWKKMLKLISGEKEIVRRIIGGKGEEYDLSTRPIYFNRSIMSIHIMDSKGLIPVLKKLLLENQDILSGSFIKYFSDTNRLFLSGTKECLKEWEEYSYNRYVLKQEYQPIRY